MVILLILIKFLSLLQRIGFDNQIVERNKARINDDIYVTGNIGDSYLGLKIIQKKIND